MLTAKKNKINIDFRMYTLNLVSPREILFSIALKVNIKVVQSKLNPKTRNKIYRRANYIVTGVPVIPGSIYFKNTI